MEGPRMGTVGPHKGSKGAQNLSGQGHFLLFSPVLTELSVPLSDQKASNFMSSILNVSIPSCLAPEGSEENYS